MSRSGRSNDTRESGNAMIIAIIVITVVSLLAVVAVARTISSQTSSRRSQDFQGALGGADTGVSAALFRLDQIGDGPIEGACPSTDPPPCTIDVVPGSPGTMYTMEVIDTFTVRIRSKGVTNGVPHAVEVVAKRTQLLPFAVFGRDLVAFRGQAETITTSPEAVPTTIGTNGTATCTPSNPADKSVVYPPGSAGACGSTVGEGVYNPQPPTESCPAPANTPSTPCAPATTLACPLQADGITLLATITTGFYRCNQRVVFPATLTPSGRVDLFIFPPAGVEPFDLAESTVNYSGTVPQDASLFRLYAAGSGREVTSGVSNKFKFSGLLYAPGVTLDGDGCQSEYNGAIIVAGFDCNGGPNLSINYDTRLAKLANPDWKIGDFQEISSSNVVRL